MFFRHMLSVLFEIILFIERSGVGGGRVEGFGKGDQLLPDLSFQRPTPSY